MVIPRNQLAEVDNMVRAMPHITAIAPTGSRFFATDLNSFRDLDYIGIIDLPATFDEQKALIDDMVAYTKNWHLTNGYNLSGYSWVQGTQEYYNEYTGNAVETITRFSFTSDFASVDVFFFPLGSDMGHINQSFYISYQDRIQSWKTKNPDYVGELLFSE